MITIYVSLKSVANSLDQQVIVYLEYSIYTKFNGDKEVLNIGFPSSPNQGVCTIIFERKLQQVPLEIQLFDIVTKMIMSQHYYNTSMIVGATSFTPRSVSTVTYLRRTTVYIEVKTQWKYCTCDFGGSQLAPPYLRWLAMVLSSPNLAYYCACSYPVVFWIFILFLDFTIYKACVQY